MILITFYLIVQLLVAVHTSSQLEVKEAAAPPTAQSVEEYYAARLQGAMIRCAENPTRWVIPPDALSSPVSGSVKRSTATPTPTGVTSATLTPTGAAVTQEASNGEERGAEALPHDN